MTRVDRNKILRLFNQHTQNDSYGSCVFFDVYVRVVNVKIYVVMPIQCFCFRCAGKRVHRATFWRHGRKSKPDPPVQVAPVNMVSMVEAKEETETDNEASDSNSDGEDADDDRSNEQDEAEDDCPNEEDELDATELFGRLCSEDIGADGRAELDAPETVLLFLDWMCTNKSTDVSARSVWAMIVSKCSEEASMPTFNQIKRMLNLFSKDAVRKIEVICKFM